MKTIVTTSIVFWSVFDPCSNIQVEIFGVPADCTSHQTKPILNNGFHPVWNKTLPKFTVTCPELALVMFRVMDKESQNDVMVAQYCLPFNCIQSGYRMIALRDVRGNVVSATSLFVHITIESLKWAFAQFIYIFEVSVWANSFLKVSRVSFFPSYWIAKTFSYLLLF